MNIKNRKGSTLALTIMIFAVLMIFATFTLGFMVTENKQAMYHQNKVKAYYAARSGAEIAAATLEQKFQQTELTAINDLLDSLLDEGVANGREFIISDAIPGLTKVLISKEVVDENDLLRIDSEAVYGDVVQKVSQYFIPEVVSIYEDVSKNGGSPFIAINAATALVKNVPENLFDPDPTLGIIFAEQIAADSSLYPQYNFPELPTIEAFTMPAINDEYKVEEVNITGAITGSVKHYPGSLTADSIDLQTPIYVFGDLTLTGDNIINSDIYVMGKATISGSVTLMNGSFIRVNGDLSIGNNGSLQVGGTSSIITNNDLLLNGTNIALDFTKGSTIHVGHDFVSGSGSSSNISGEVIINVNNNFNVNGTFNILDKDASIDDLVNINVVEKMNINYLSNSLFYNGLTGAEPSNMVVHVYNKSGQATDISLRIEVIQDGRIVGDFYVKTGITDVSLKSAYFEGNLISNQPYTETPNYYEHQSTSTVRVTTPNSNVGTFVGSVYARDGYVLLGGNVLNSDKIALDQSGIVVGSYVLVQGLNETQTDKSYLIDLFDNLQSNSVSVPVQMQSATKIEKINYKSVYIDPGK